MDELSIIKKYISPIGVGIGSDVGLLEKSSYIVSTDVLIEGVHFFDDTRPELIAKKLIRVNLSDIAASCCRPVSYTLCIAAPPHLGEEWFEAFFKSIDEENSAFNLKLIGGDTVVSKYGIVVSATIFGWQDNNPAVMRSGAKPGESVYVTGTLGDAAFGLLAYRNVVIDRTGYLRHRYDLPTPRTNIGLLLSGKVSSCIDISDGLLQDAGHICSQSNVGIDIYFDEIPISKELKDVLTNENRNLIVNGGDDYELLFTTLNKDIVSIGNIKKIGYVRSGSNVRLLDSNGSEIYIETKGYSHLF